MEKKTKGMVYSIAYPQRGFYTFLNSFCVVTRCECIWTQNGFIAENSWSCQGFNCGVSLFPESFPTNLATILDIVSFGHW